MNTEDVVQCYVCYGGAEGQGFAEAVCACKGSIKIHVGCYENLLSNGVKMCTICKTEYPPLRYNGLTYIVYLDMHGSKEMYTVDSDGKKHGIYRRLFSNGNLHKMRIYYHGNEEGVSQDWFDNGDLAYVRNFTNGAVDGIHHEFHHNGTYSRKSSHKMRNGEENENPTVVRYWYSNGQLRCVYTTQHGYKHGVEQGWYTNGFLKWCAVYVDGILQGGQELWSDDGMPYTSVLDTSYSDRVRNHRHMG